MSKIEMGHLGRTQITGTSGNDSLFGTDGDDVIRGLDGNDTLQGGGGHDRLVGGDGDDALNGVGTLLGGQGDDELRGDGTLLGGGGDDWLSGSPGALLDGGAGAGDYFSIDRWNETASETLFLGRQAKGHVVALADGTRLLYLETGNLTLGSGDDFVDLGKTAVNVWAREGDDYIINRGSAFVELDGGDGNDTIMGGRGLDWVFGGRGDDVLSGRGGDSDLLDYSLADTGVRVDLRLTTAQDTGGAGVDTVSGFENLRGSFNADVLIGDDGDNYLDGYGHRDTLIGGGGDDTLMGAHISWPPGGDETTLIGGAGHDVMWSGKDVDTFAYEALSDSTNEHPDQIFNLNRDGVQDVIDLSAIDADTTTVGDQSFHRVSAFGHHAGELVMIYADSTTSILVDVNGDARADMTIQIAYDHADFTGFIL
jgi:Ca2+-binding RTX toxin-like protein